MEYSSFILCQSGIFAHVLRKVIWSSKWQNHVIVVLYNCFIALAPQDRVGCN